MTANDAAWKIINLKGTPTVTSLMNYGVPFTEAQNYMRWYISPRAKRFRTYLKNKDRGRKPCIMLGYNTAHR